MTLTFYEACLIASSWPGLKIDYAPDYDPFLQSKKRYVIEFDDDEDEET